jgi:DNA-binding CsgD family transcriptional regulator
MDLNLVDRIHECGFVPEKWPEVLRDASKLSGSAGASLFVAREDVLAWTASRNALPVAERFVTEGWYWRGRLMSLVHDSAHPGFLRDDDICARDELEQEPVYRDFWRQVGLGFGAATAFDLPSGERVSVILSRLTADGPVEADAIRWLDTLRPHLARTATLSARMRLERARAAGDALALLGLAALVFGEGGRVLFANSLVEGHVGLLSWRAADRVTLTDRRADALLSEGLQRMGQPDNRGMRSFPVRHGETGDLFVGHLVPLRLSARDIFARGAAVFVLMPINGPSAPPVELMRSLFDLTPAEARVARGLVDRRTVDEIADEFGVSPNTIRVQVRALLEKTGVHRQTDLVALLSGLMPARAPAPETGSR